MKRARTRKAKDARIQLLLDAALAEFVERGFSAARMDDIAARANLSKGTLYIYFDSKEALFNGLIDAVALPKLDQIRRLVATSTSFEEALTILAKFAEATIRESTLPRLVKVLIGESNNFPETVQRYRSKVLDRILAVFAELLRNADARGEISVSDPALTARLVVSPIIFSALWHVVFTRKDETEVDLAALFSLHGQILCKALINSE
ncbi:MAG: TetR/AcrR family transcriptional regulator [Gammaproteobacteria bacterium]|nr:TetR/AcrR family transcriptional regulator [Gammaproteobacteria bacterium]